MNPDIAKAGENTRFSKDNQPGNQGRKKNRFAHLKDQFQLSAADVEDVFTYLLSLQPDELIKITEDPEASVITIAFATAIIKCIKKGDTSQINNMLDRIHGKAPEKHKHEIENLPRNIIVEAYDSRSEDKSPSESSSDIQFNEKI